MTHFYSSTISFQVNTDAWTFIDVVFNKCRFIGSEIARPNGGTFVVNDAPRRTSGTYEHGGRHGYIELVYDAYYLKDGDDGVPVAHKLLPLSVAAMQLGPGRCEVVIKGTGQFRESCALLLDCIQKTYPEVRLQLDLPERTTSSEGNDEMEIEEQEEDEDYYEFTPREREVARMLAQGYTKRQTACKLGIAPKTVESHAQNMSIKVKARDGLDKDLSWGELQVRIIAAGDYQT